MLQGANLLMRLGGSPLHSTWCCFAFYHNLISLLLLLLVCVCVWENVTYCTKTGRKQKREEEDSLENI